MTYSIKGKEVEYKTVSFLVKSIDQDQGIVTGLASPMTNVDLQKDQVEPGAYTKTLAEAEARMKNGRRFMYATLWMHKEDHPTGGVVSGQETPDGLLVSLKHDISTNAAGYPNNPTATMVFSGFKFGYIDELSVGYIAVKYDYDKSGVRHLREMQLIEISSVTMLFAANPEALVPASGVKSMAEQKAVTGNTSLPIGPRNDTWSGASAKKQIFAYAKEGEEFNVSKLKECFLLQDGDAQLKGSWHYPFVDIVSGSPQINVAGVIACAGALNGARNADAGIDSSGMRKKVATLYGHINKKYPDDPQLTPPWDDEGKRGAMNVQRKDFNELFVTAMAADCLEDWGDLINTLTAAMLQLFAIGDTPASDMTASLEQFGKAVDGWVEKAIECDLSQYISDQGYCNNPNQPYVPYSLSAGSSYGWMSRTKKPDSKAGRTISAATQGTLEQHQSEMKDMLETMSGHVGAMQQKVSDLTQVWQDTDQGEPYSNDKSRIQRREPPQTLTRGDVQPLHKSTVDDMTVADLEALFT